MASTTPARLLRLLSLLQARPHWSGPELAARLGVTTRTVRRDVDRLRTLGYPVDAAPGAAGGYRLGPGGALPPLLLDDDEAIAVAVALGTSARSAVEGIEESALAALAKLDRLLPPALRARVASLRSATVRLDHSTDDAAPEVLSTAATAIAGNERCVLAYRDRAGRESARRVEPYRLVCTGRRWYLVAYDVDRRDWRTFRVDRVVEVRATGHRFTPDPDAPDAAGLVSRASGVAPYDLHVRVAIDAPVHEVRGRIPPTAGVVEPSGDGRALLTVGSDHAPSLLGHLVALDLPFEILQPAELRAAAAALGERLVTGHR